MVHSQISFVCNVQRMHPQQTVAAVHYVSCSAVLFFVVLSFHCCDACWGNFLCASCMCPAAFYTSFFFVILPSHTSFLLVSFSYGTTESLCMLKILTSRKMRNFPCCTIQQQVLFVLLHPSLCITISQLLQHLIMFIHPSSCQQESLSWMTG